MPIRSLQELFIHELSDIYSAEKQLTKALPRMASAASDQRLAEAFEIHGAEMASHLERIDQVMESLDVRPRRAKCAAAEALVDEVRDMIDVIDRGSVLDTALLTGIQKLTRYQIAAHGALVVLVRRLDYRDALPALVANLEEKTASEVRFARLGGYAPPSAAHAA